MCSLLFYCIVYVLERELRTHSGLLRSPLVCRGVCATRSLVLCVCFVDRFFGHCIVCRSAIDWFWLPLLYLQTLLLSLQLILVIHVLFLLFNCINIYLFFFFIYLVFPCLILLYNNTWVLTICFKVAQFCVSNVVFVPCILANYYTLMYSKCRRIPWFCILVANGSISQWHIRKFYKVSIESLGI